jgi:hypothetical protein
MTGFYCTHEQCKRALSCARYWENAPIGSGFGLFLNFDPDCELFEPIK